jgi:hypothetical protein
LAFLGHFLASHKYTSGSACLDKLRALPLYLFHFLTQSTRKQSSPGHRQQQQFAHKANTFFSLSQKGQFEFAFGSNRCRFLAQRQVQQRAQSYKYTLGERIRSTDREKEIAFTDARTSTGVFSCSVQCLSCIAFSQPRRGVNELSARQTKKNGRCNKRNPLCLSQGYADCYLIFLFVNDNNGERIKEEEKPSYPLRRARRVSSPWQHETRCCCWGGGCAAI